MSDEQDRAEALDEDVVDAVDDISGDEYGEGLPSYPPDRLQGSNTVGDTPVEEDAGESFAERTERLQPEADVPVEPLDELREETFDEEYAEDAALVDVGQLVDDYDGRPDDEERLLGERAPGRDISPEQSAMRIESETPGFD